MQQHLQRLDGVAKAEVSLLEGRVVITPKAEGVMDPYKILKATFDSGVTVTEMHVTVRGTIARQGDALLIRLNPKQSLEIVANSVAGKLKSLAGTDKAVTLRGVLYRKVPGKGKVKLPTTGLKLEVTEISEAN